MSKKSPPETEPIQSENFRKAVREIEADGEPSLTEADGEFERILSRVASPKSAKRRGE